MQSVPTDLGVACLAEIVDYLSKELKRSGYAAFLILDPDRCRRHYAGEKLRIDEQEYRCRSWRAWNDLATQLGSRILTPERYDARRLLLRFEAIERNGTFHQDNEAGKYAPGSTFARIRKNEEPAFYLPYLRALRRLGAERRSRILDLGLNRGDELEPVFQAGFTGTVWGIDLDEAALAEAKRRFGTRLHTRIHDLNRLEDLPQERFDLILSIGTLQSPGIELKPLLMHLVQERLTPDGAILLGWPNARWIDGELLYGARVKHYPFSELSLVIKDLFWVKKYLQQHRFRVVITGREYLFLEATRIGVRS